MYVIYIAIPVGDLDAARFSKSQKKTGISPSAY